MTRVTIDAGKQGGGGVGSKISLWLNIILLVVLIGMYAYFQLRPPPPPEIINTVETVVDTVYVDRVERELVAVHDTVIVEKPAVFRPGIGAIPPLQTYTRNYQDSLIVARVETTVEGWLREQRFFYTPIINHITVTHNNVRTIVEEKPVYLNRNFIQAGLEAGIVGGKLQVNPMVGYTTGGGLTTYYRYSPWDRGHTIGFLTPMRFPSFKLPWK